MIRFDQFQQTVLTLAIWSRTGSTFLTIFLEIGTLDPLLTIALFTIVWVVPESLTIAIFGLNVVVADDLKGQFQCHKRSFDRSWRFGSNLPIRKVFESQFILSFRTWPGKIGNHQDTNKQTTFIRIIEIIACIIQSLQPMIHSLWVISCYKMIRVQKNVIMRLNLERFSSLFPLLEILRFFIPSFEKLLNLNWKL